MFELAEPFGTVPSRVFYLQRFTVLQHASAVYTVIGSSKQLHTCASLIHIQYISHIALMSRQQSDTLLSSSCEVSFDQPDNSFCQIEYISTSPALKTMTLTNL